MVEITYNRENQTWHTHLHVLFSGEYLDQKLASLVWHNVTGDSFIVDVREVKRREIAVGYVVKYAGKAVDSSVTSRVEAFEQAIKAMKGRRTLATFGTWRHLDLSRPPEDGEEWAVVMPLHKLIERAVKGDKDAQMVLARLKREPTTYPLFDGEPDDG